MGSVLQQLNGPGPGPGPGPASGRRISWQKLAPAEDMQLRKRGEDAGKDIVRSLESLCKVWSHSEDSQLSPPHICNILTVSHHAPRTTGSPCPSRWTVSPLPRTSGYL